MTGDGPAGEASRWTRVEATGEGSQDSAQRESGPSAAGFPVPEASGRPKTARAREGSADAPGRSARPQRSERGRPRGQRGEARGTRGDERKPRDRGGRGPHPDREAGQSGSPRPGTDGKARSFRGRDGKGPRGPEGDRQRRSEGAGRSAGGGRRDAERSRGGGTRGERDAAPQRGGPRLAPKQERRPEPAIAEDVTGFEIDRAVKNELRTLSKDNAKGVGQHLVMVARLLDVDIVAARAHAETAVRRAGRVAAVRETRGLVAYREGDFQLALSEFRTARRLSGSQHLLPLMVDCERGLGRPERALELAGSPEARTLGRAERLELLIVCSGIRRDMGDLDAAVVLLEVPELNPSRRDPWSARLFYAYADALLARGDSELARAWFAEAADADADNLTDAPERLDELDGIVFVDLDEGAEETEAAVAADAHDAAGGVAPADAADPEAAHPADPADPADVAAAQDAAGVAGEGAEGATAADGAGDPHGESQEPAGYAS